MIVSNNKSGKIKEFTDLIVWQEGHKLVLLVYRATDKFPGKETFSLTSQLTRCAISVTSNISEWFGRQTYKEKIHFYYLAQGSLSELKNQIIIARDVGYLKEKDYQRLKVQADITHKLLQGLIKSSKGFLNRKS